MDCPFCVDRFATCPEHWGEDDGGRRHDGYLFDLWIEPSSLDGPWPSQDDVLVRRVRSRSKAGKAGESRTSD